MPYQQRLAQTCQELHYYPSRGGTELNLLICLLAVVGKPVEQLTRADFDTFQSQYQTWYLQSGRQKSGRPDPRLFRLERYLVHWGIFPAARHVFRHEEHFARLRYEPIRQAILVHMQWCDAKYTQSTIHSRRATLLTFFSGFKISTQIVPVSTRSIVLSLWNICSFSRTRWRKGNSRPNTAPIFIVGCVSFTIS